MNGRTGEPRLAAAASWAVLAASFGLSAATWVALALMAGFTGHIVVVPLAWLMPVAVDGYVVVALVVWMSPVPAKVARFARTNTYCAASVGVIAQSAFHALTVWSQTATVWRAVLAAVVGALPPAVAALAVHMRALLRRENGHSDDVAVVLEDDTEDTAADQPELPVALHKAKRPPRADSAVGKVAAARRRSPAASQSEIARRTELSLPTVRKHWPTTASTTGNGHSTAPVPADEYVPATTTPGAMS